MRPIIALVEKSAFRASCTLAHDEQHIKVMKCNVALLEANRRTKYESTMNADMMMQHNFSLGEIPYFDDLELIHSPTFLGYCIKTL